MVNFTDNSYFIDELFSFFLWNCSGLLRRRGLYRIIEIYFISKFVAYEIRVITVHILYILWILILEFEYHNIKVQVISLINGWIYNNSFRDARDLSHQIGYGEWDKWMLQWNTPSLQVSYFVRNIKILISYSTFCKERFVWDNEDGSSSIRIMIVKSFTIPGRPTILLM